MDTATAPFRSPLRARIERREELASMIGKLDRVRRKGRDRGETAMGGESISGVGMGLERAQSRGHSFTREKIQRSEMGRR